METLNKYQIKTMKYVFSTTKYEAISDTVEYRISSRHRNVTKMIHCKYTTEIYMKKN